MTIKQFEPMHPGAFIKEVYLTPFDICFNQLARALKLSKGMVSRLLNGNASVTPDLSLRLSTALGRSPESWLRMQDNVDLSNVRHQFKAKEVKQLKFA